MFLQDPTAFRPFSFFGINCEYEKAKIVLVPIPYDATASNQAGARNGPVAIISESLETESFDFDLKSDVSSSIHTANFLNVFDEPAKIQKKVYETISTIIKDGKIPVIIGGDHSLTPAAVRAVRKNYPQKLLVTTFDAHSDLREEYRDNKFSHASAMRRVRDSGIKTLHIGVRSSAEELEDYIKNKNIKILNAEDIKTSDPSRIFQKMKIYLGYYNYFYLSFDFDVYDPSIMTTGTPEPHGLNFGEVAKIMEIFKGKQIVGADFMEFSPLSFQNNGPANLAVRTIAKFLNLILF